MDNASARFGALDTIRRAHLDRARDCSALTAPWLLPPEGHSINDPLLVAWQNLGSRCVHNLASKLLLILFPPQIPFFRLEISDYEMKLQAIQAIDPATGVSLLESFMEAFSRIERATLLLFSKNRLRNPLYQLLLNVIITGSAMWQDMEDGRYRVYRLDNWVCRRDPEGDLVETVTREYKYWEALDEETKTNLKALHGEEIGKGNKELLPLYTWGVLDPSSKTWKVTQSLMDYEITKESIEYSPDKFPFHCASWIRICGEDYGRGQVENHLGDLRTLESSSQIIQEGSAAAAKILFLVDPNGTVRATKIAKTPNGGFVEGKADEVTALQVNKYYDFKGIQDLMQLKTQELSYAFLLNSAIQRNAERVTAEEIRVMASELEQALGGTYALLAEELQMPIANSLLQDLNIQKFIPPVVKDKIQVIVSTGIEGLGRTHELSQYNAFLQNTQLLPNASSWINTGVALKRLATYHSVDITGIIKTPVEVEQEMTNQQNMALAEKATPEATKIVANTMANQPA